MIQSHYLQDIIYSSQPEYPLKIKVSNSALTLESQNERDNLKKPTEIRNFFTSPLKKILQWKPASVKRKKKKTLHGVMNSKNYEKTYDTRVKVTKKYPYRIHFFTNYIRWRWNEIHHYSDPQALEVGEKYSERKKNANIVMFCIVSVNQNNEDS